MLYLILYNLFMVFIYFFKLCSYYYSVVLFFIPAKHSPSYFTLIMTVSFRASLSFLPLSNFHSFSIRFYVHSVFFMQHFVQVIFASLFVKHLHLYLLFERCYTNKFMIIIISKNFFKCFPGVSCQTNRRPNIIWTFHLFSWGTP